VSGTFVLNDAEEQELILADGLPRSVKQAVRDGRLVPNELAEASAKSMLDELVRVAAALAPLRGAA
jgi:hypothetical protein